MRAIRDYILINKEELLKLLCLSNQEVKGVIDEDQYVLDVLERTLTNDNEYRRKFNMCLAQMMDKNHRLDNFIKNPSHAMALTLAKDIEYDNIDLSSEQIAKLLSLTKLCDCFELEEAIYEDKELCNKLIKYLLEIKDYGRIKSLSCELSKHSSLRDAFIDSICKLDNNNKAITFFNFTNNTCDI